MNGQHALITRLDEQKAQAVRTALPTLRYYVDGRVGAIGEPPQPPPAGGTILVVAAGTADIPVSEEAAVTAELMGNRVDRLYDVGVAGLHRLLDSMEKLRTASVLIVVAGMEGALPSVIGGLVDRPVVAVPTSIGYGASFNGLAALLAMLNSCAAGVTVVNIDNGFGAAAAATLMNRLRA
jgi:NCAIR mutase (PurE)-related protein